MWSAKHTMRRSVTAYKSDYCSLTPFCLHLWVRELLTNHDIRLVKSQSGETKHTTLSPPGPPHQLPKGKAMAQRSALVLVDPLNDFLHPNGKLHPLLKESLDTTDTLSNLRTLVEGTRAAKIPIYYGLHQVNKDGTYAGWLHMRANHVRNRDKGVFTGRGAEIVEGLEPKLSNGDVVANRHWNSNAFKNTDLDYQLRQREITHLTIAGMIANTCLEATAREATELGYRVTLLKDCTAGFSDKLKEAGEVVWPTLFEEVTTSKQWLAWVREEPRPKV